MARERKSDVIHEEHISSPTLRINPAVTVNYHGLHEVYSASVYGQYHATQPLRYSQSYDYDPTSMLDDLGEDIHPVGHMLHTERKIAVPFIRVQNNTGARDYSGRHLTPEEIVTLRLTALLHDIGECAHPDIPETVGDVFYETKTTEDETKEAGVRGFVYDQVFRGVPLEIIERAEQVIAGGHNDFLDEAFNTIERVGYFATAIRAGEIALRQVNKDPSLIETRQVVQLGRLSLRVSDNHGTILLERGEVFPAARLVVERHARLFDSVHSKFSQLAYESVVIPVS